MLADTILVKRPANVVMRFRSRLQWLTGFLLVSVA